jgi:excisionase family DNA binding protein
MPRYSDERIEQKTFPIKEAAAVLRLKDSAVRSLMYSGEIPGTYHRGRYRVPRRAIKAYADGLVVGNKIAPWMKDDPAVDAFVAGLARRPTLGDSPGMVELATYTPPVDIEARLLVPPRVAQCELCEEEKPLCVVLAGRRDKIYVRICAQCARVVDALDERIGAPMALAQRPREILALDAAPAGRFVSLDHLRECRPRFPPIPWPAKESLTVNEVAELLGISPAAASNAITSAKLPGAYRVGGSRRVLRRPLQAALSHIANGHAWDLSNTDRPRPTDDSGIEQLDEQASATGPDGVPLEHLLLSIREAAALLSVSDSLIRQLMAEKRFPGIVRVGPRSLISYAALKRWIDRGGSASDPPPATSRKTDRRRRSSR